MSGKVIATHVVKDWAEWSDVKRSRYVRSWMAADYNDDGTRRVRSDFREIDGQLLITVRGLR
jgi:hypothetical protein